MTLSISSALARTYFGKYRGTVVNNIDPKQEGRLMLTVPDVTGETPTDWAPPVVLLAGPTGLPMGMYAIPPIGAGVWVEFEQGDAGKPIWIGCRWGSTADIPMSAKLGIPASPNICFQTLNQHMLMLSDMPSSPETGGIVLKSITGAKIIVNDAGIFIDNGKGASITLTANTVNINLGALTVA
ncbi:baseplate assembly protein [Caballeronia megalochromosomata]|jgi:Type VI secretion system/phage-baseplate injector OB domain|nr:baseplate assembly protein [Caballeronia megalochromosomata]